MRARTSRTRMRRLAAPALLLASAILLAGCSASDPLASKFGGGGGQNYVSGDGSELEVALDKRGSAIEFTGTGADGQKIASSDYAGKVYVVNFWWANCPPCRAEAPTLSKVSKEYEAKGVDFLGVNTYDTSQGVIDAFDTKFDIDYPSIVDADTNAVQLAFAKDVPPNAIPSTLVIDRKGRVAARITGYIQDGSILTAMIDRVVAETDS